MERLYQLAHEGHWAQAIRHAHALALDPPLLASLAHHALASSPAHSLSLPHLDALLPLLSLSDDHPLAIRLALRIATDPPSPAHAHRALDAALRAAERAIAAHAPLAHAVAHADWATVDHLVTAGDDDARTAVLARRAVLDLEDRVSTWEALFAPDAPHPPTEPPTPRVAQQGPVAGEARGDEDDDAGWGDDLDLPSESHDGDDDDDHDALANPDAQRDAATPAPPPVDTPSRPSLRTFLVTPLAPLAQHLASSASLPELSLLCTLHPSTLWPLRAALVDAVPAWVDPQAWGPLLPAVDPETGAERMWDDVAPWRAELDWSEALPSLSLSLSHSPSPSPAASSSLGAPLPERRTAPQLREWYLSRIALCASPSLGLIDVALALSQHGAARGVPGLDEAGEELSLLGKLVYERPVRTLGETQEEGEREREGEGWSLERWRKMEPDEVVRAYTATSGPDDLPDTVRRLVLPYLSVLESRLERAAPSPSTNPTPTPTTRSTSHLLHTFLVTLPLSPARPGPLGLEALSSLISHSKPTLPRARRIVTDDADLARVVLAAVYGCGARAASDEGVRACGTMFECLPAFAEVGPLPGPGDDDVKGADLFALAAASPSPSPTTLLAALSLSPPRALASALDTLDLHLSQLELLARYRCAPRAGLAWFLAAYRDERAQRACATRLARTAAQGGKGAGGEGGEGEGAFEGEDEWVALMEFMREATGVAGEGLGDEDEERRRERGLGRMLHCLGEDEVLRIFFGGLLGAGRASLSLSDPLSLSYLGRARARDGRSEADSDPPRRTGFSLARALFEPSSVEAPLEPHVVEELVVAASREFYDNAEAGNLHEGDMKLALEWCVPLSLPSLRSLPREPR